MRGIKILSKIFLKRVKMEVGDTFHPRDIYIDKTRAERVEETATGIKQFVTVVERISVSPFPMRIEHLRIVSYI